MLSVNLNKTRLPGKIKCLKITQEKTLMHIKLCHKQKNLNLKEFCIFKKQQKIRKIQIQKF